MDPPTTVDIMTTMVTAKNANWQFIVDLNKRQIKREDKSNRQGAINDADTSMVRPFPR